MYWFYIITFYMCATVFCTHFQNAHRMQTPFEQNRRVKRSLGYKAYINATVYTVDTNTDWYDHPESIIIFNTDGVIEYVGSDHAEVGRLDLNKDDVIDLEGLVIVPGLHDIHQHPLESMSPVGGTCKLTADTDPRTLVNYIKTSKCAEKQIGTDWVLGWGHSVSSLLDYMDLGLGTPRELLDQAISDKPAVIMEQTSHSAWVNSEALRRAKITRDTKRMGGIVMVDSSGEPNGILLENEVQEILDIALSPTSELDRLNYCGLSAAMKLLPQNGITSICDARLYWKRNHQAAWNKVCDKGELNVRAILGLWAYPAMTDDKQISELKKMYSHASDRTKCDLRKSQIKVYMDGIIDSTTAAVFQAYEFDLQLPTMDDNKGRFIFTEDRLEKYVRELQNFDGNRGFDFHIHAIGDRGVHGALNVLNKTHINDTRHRITHIELVKLDDIPRFKDLDVIADFQVAGNFTLPTEENLKYLQGLIGERYKRFILVKSIVNSGAVTTFSSDWDVSSVNPFIGIQHATERGEQSVNVSTALEMYTINSAFAMRQEQEVGSLVKGKKADFIVIDKDILKCPTREIGQTKVILTVLGGKVVYDIDDAWKDPKEYLTKCIDSYKDTNGSTHCIVQTHILYLLLYIAAHYYTV